MSYRVLSVFVVLNLFRGTQLYAQTVVDSSVISIGTSFHLTSRYLNGLQEVMVYVPPDAEHHRFPVIVTTDGDYAFLHTVSAVKFLAQATQMPPAIVVGIGHADRNHDLTPSLTQASLPPDAGNFGGANAFLKYIAEELMPYLDARYPTQPFRTLIGHSLGGLFATYAMVTQPEVFQGYITLEPSLWWDNRAMVRQVEQFFRQHPTYKGRLMMVEGTSKEGWRPDWPKLERLKPEGMQAARIDVAGESHETMAFRGRYEALRRLFADYVPQMRQNESRATLTALEEQYSTLSGAYGYRVAIPLAAFEEVARRDIGRSRYASAVQTTERALVSYPSATSLRTLQDEARRLLATSQVDVRRPTVKRPSAAEAAPFLGQWRGILKTEPGVPTKITLVLEKESDSVTGYLITHGIAVNGGDLRTDLSSIRVQGGVLEWDREGQSAGMHVHIGRLRQGDKLEGHVEFRGGPPPPAGFVQPKVTFSLRRLAGTDK